MKPVRLVATVVAIGSLTLGLMMVLKRPPKIEIREVRVEGAVVEKQTSTEVLVAAQDFDSGKVFSARELKWAKWPEDAVHSSFITKKNEPKALEDYAGAISRTPFVSGEPIRLNKIVRAGAKNSYMSVLITPGMRGIAVSLSPETGAGGFILPNDKVDVIMVRRLELDTRSRAAGGAIDHEATTVLNNVRVLAVDQIVEDKNGEKTVLARTATLELSPGQAETLSLASKLGTVSLTLRSLSEGNGDKVVAKDGDDDDEKAEKSPFKKKEGNQVKVIKFGVNTGAGGQ